MSEKVEIKAGTKFRVPYAVELRDAGWRPKLDLERDYLYHSDYPDQFFSLKMLQGREGSLLTVSSPSPDESWFNVYNCCDCWPVQACLDICGAPNADEGGVYELRADNAAMKAEIGRLVKELAGVGSTINTFDTGGLARNKTLLDEFAGLAMQGFVYRHGLTNDYDRKRVCYNIAEDMVAEKRRREKNMPTHRIPMPTEGRSTNAAGPRA